MQSLEPVPFSSVHLTDHFWSPRIEHNREVTIPFCFKKCEETGRIDNFSKAAGLMPGAFVGIIYNDSDVYKLIEGASYSLSQTPNAELDHYLDGLIAKIAGAQEADGYLYTGRTIPHDKDIDRAGPERWSSLYTSHELYNVGHLYEAAVAHFLATGKRTLLDVALKNAALIDATFGPGKRVDPPGHQEIELGLIKLYRLLHDEKYLHLSQFFIDVRGENGDRRKLYGKYAQDHLPVREQTEAVGHAVRAGYMYSAMAELASITSDTSLEHAVDRLWHDVVGSKIYVTGGIGARHGQEDFGDAYELPNRTSYCETCAAVANVLWNHRMFLLKRDARYMDVAERALYNGFLAGVSLSGDRFFYVNPLCATSGMTERQPWYDCACCPVNVVRFLPSVPGLIYARLRDTLYVNLFIAGDAEVAMGDSKVRIKQQTDYPWDGTVKISLGLAKPTTFELRVRIPGWARGEALSGDLYQFAPGGPAADVICKLNGKAVSAELDHGYQVLRREWRDGDEVEIVLPMPVRRVHCNPRVASNAGQVALERGPLVYALEGKDHASSIFNLLLPPAAELTPRAQPDLLGGITVLEGQAQKLNAAAEGDTPAAGDATPLRAIPYYAWNNRGQSEMEVWIPESVEGWKVSGEARK